MCVYACVYAEHYVQQQQQSLTLGGFTLHFGSGPWGVQWCQVHIEAMGPASSVSRACEEPESHLAKISRFCAARRLCSV